jgi:hypothetical protein
MLRNVISLFAFALYAGVAPAALAQMPPPPEGAPQATNPYAQPYGPNAAATAAPNPAMLAKAKKWFAQLQSGHVDRSQLENNANANMSDATISNAQRMIGSLGAPVLFVQQRAGTQSGISYAIYQLTFRNGQKLDFLFALDGEGKVASLGLGSPH